MKIFAWDNSESTPRMRGSTCHEGDVLGPVAVYPAHAGIDPNAPCARGSMGSLPRACGDRPVYWDGTGAPIESTPRMRGST